MNKINLGLIKGRHEIPDVEDYIFKDTIEDPTDLAKLNQTAFNYFGDMSMSIKEVNIYVTGLTVALIETINAAKEYGIKINLYHYNTATNSYYKQEVKW